MSPRQYQAPGQQKSTFLNMGPSFAIMRRAWKMPEKPLNYSDIPLFSGVSITWLKPRFAKRI